jgi:hypothetical protein
MPNLSLNNLEYSYCVVEGGFVGYFPSENKAYNNFKVECQNLHKLTLKN